MKYCDVDTLSYLIDRVCPHQLTYQPSAAQTGVFPETPLAFGKTGASGEPAMPGKLVDSLPTAEAKGVPAVEAYAPSLRAIPEVPAELLGGYQAVLVPTRDSLYHSLLYLMSPEYRELDSWPDQEQMVRDLKDVMRRQLPAGSLPAVLDSNTVTDGLRRWVADFLKLNLVIVRDSGSAPVEVCTGGGSPDECRPFVLLSLNLQGHFQPVCQVHAPAGLRATDRHLIMKAESPLIQRLWELYGPKPTQPVQVRKSKTGPKVVDQPPMGEPGQTPSARAGSSADEMRKALGRYKLEELQAMCHQLKIPVLKEGVRNSKARTKAELIDDLISSGQAVLV